MSAIPSHRLADLAKNGPSGSSVNLDLVAIRSVLQVARHDARLKPPLPCDGIEGQKVNNKARRLYTADEVDQLCELVLRPSRNGRQVPDGYSPALLATRSRPPPIGFATFTEDWEDAIDRAGRRE